MKKTTESRTPLRIWGIITVAVAAMLTVAGSLYAYSPEMRRAMITGPWEISVHIGLEGQGLSFPLDIADENKPEKLNLSLPVMGTPVELVVEEYLPDLQWETSVVKHDGGGTIAALSVKGPNMDRKFWLDSNDPLKQSISSSIGGMKLRRLSDPNKAEKLLRELVKPKVVGLLSIWLEGSKSPSQYVVRPGRKIEVPKSDYELTVLEYVPHYQIDMKTKKVVSQSKKPVNPAVKILIKNGKDTHEDWFWSKFPSSPHQKVELPFRIQFADFDLGGAKGHYILAAASNSKSWLVSSQDGKNKAEAVKFGQPYPFSDETYSFIIDKITLGAVVKTNWKSGSEKLSNPAVIVTMKVNESSQRSVLELNKPAHLKTDSDAVVLLFRPQRQAAQAGKAQ